jgi:MFS family permease
MFTIAAVGTNVAALPVGAILDHFGPRLCGIIGSVFLAMGATLFAFAWQLPFDGYIPGYLFLALGGPFIFISSFQLSNTFPKHSGLILALLTGAFDSSSAVFLVYRLIYQWSDGIFGPQKFFLGYLIVPALIFALQITLMPKQSYKTVGELVTDIEQSDAIIEDQVDEHTALLREETAALREQRQQRRESMIAEITELLGSKSGTKQVKQEERKERISGVWGALHGKSAKQQILSPWFVLITLFTVIQMTRINYFVATIRPQYEHLLHSYPKAVAVNDFFDVALPLGGVISIPFIGLILDNTSTTFVLTSLVTIATTIGVLGVLPYMWAAYANISLFVLYRPFYYTAVSDYSAKVFGFRTFGTVYGLIICLAGLLNLSQSGLDTLTHKTFKGNPVPVNIGLTSAALVVGLALVVFVGIKAYGMRKHKLVEEAERARETIMPGAESPGRLQ